MPRNPKSEIVKVQVPIVGPQDLVLIYNKDKRKISQRPYTTFLREKMNGRLKAYFYGTYRYDRGWSISTEAPTQEW